MWSYNIQIATHFICTHGLIQPGPEQSVKPVRQMPDHFSEAIPQSKNLESIYFLSTTIYFIALRFNLRENNFSKFSGGHAFIAIPLEWHVTHTYVLRTHSECTLSVFITLSECLTTYLEAALALTAPQYLLVHSYMITKHGKVMKGYNIGG